MKRYNALTKKHLITQNSSGIQVILENDANEFSHQEMFSYLQIHAQKHNKYNKSQWHDLEYMKIEVININFNI